MILTLKILFMKESTEGTEESVTAGDTRIEEEVESGGDPEE